MRRVVVLLLAGAAMLGAVPSGARADACTPRVLVLSAFPGEIDHLLAATEVAETFDHDGRTFYTGTLGGHDVALALTGIGLVNADETAEAAVDAFACEDETAIEAVVFSGVSGGETNIGDVTIPDRWTLDGIAWNDVDPSLLATAEAAAADVALARAVPLGDIACAGIDPTLVSTVELPDEPEIIVGGDGKSADPFGGRELPCIPGGGDVFGCDPCRRPGPSADEAQRFATGAVPFIDPAFFFGYFESPPAAEPGFVAVDMETAAVARVASEHTLPFIAFRALSDGGGDPLMLPGFPFQFFYYRQIAAENAARVTLAFLEDLPAA